MRGARGWATAVAIGLAGACAQPPPPAPGPPPQPVAPEPAGAAPPSEVTTAPSLPEPAAPVIDEILSSPLVRDPDFRAVVAEWVDFWRERNAAWFPAYLERMAVFSPTVDSVLARRGLPPSLRYLPIVESGYSPRAVSRARAVGLWQFMRPTAEGFGMAVGPLLDERRSPFKSTEAAASFLGSLRDRFGSWFLALAAYNAGPGRVEGVMRRHAPLVPGSDSLYWALRHRLPAETQDFVPKFFAAAEVAGNPERHGFQPPAAPAGFAFDQVVVPDATTLDVVAEAAESTQEEIERLNPEVVRGITPPGRETLVRVPAGKGWIFRDNYARIPPSERVTFVEHRVASGETFSHIARRYGVPLSELRAANPGVRPRRLQIGQRLTVPIAPRARGRRGSR